MEAVPQPVLASLDLLASTTAEASTWRNLIPPEPWYDAAKQRPRDFSSWVETNMAYGAKASEVSIVYARKPTPGVRPVPIVGAWERIALNAICSSILDGIPVPARSAEDYKEFVLAPINKAFATANGFRRLRDAQIRYIVETDIAAFYQYVDHEILGRELALQTGKIRECSIMVELLGEIQGTTYGIPQLLNSSDRLSEAYIQIVERDLVRRGLTVWRYNDDFRIGTTTYAEAQLAIEQIGDATRIVGLTLNEGKTRTVGIVNYVLRYYNGSVDDDDAQIDPNNININDSDYGEKDDSEKSQAAIDTLKRIKLPPDDSKRIDLKNISPEQQKEIRRAVNTLSRLENDGGLEYVVRLLVFLPWLTPRLCDYMITMGTLAPDRVDAIWKSATSSTFTETLSDWQCLWLAYTGRCLQSTLVKSAHAVTWLRAQAVKKASDLLHAESCLSLAVGGNIDFSDLDVSLRLRPEPLASWYVLAIKELNNLGLVSNERIKALKETSVFYRHLMDS